MLSGKEIESFKWSANIYTFMLQMSLQMSPNYKQQQCEASQTVISKIFGTSYTKPNTNNFLNMLQFP